MTAVTVNGLNINDVTNYIVKNIDYRSMPTRDMVVQNIASGPGSKIVASEWSDKQIAITGYIFGSSVANLKANIDAMQLAFSGNFNYTSKNNVSININDGESIYDATLKSMKVEQQEYTATMTTYEALFTAPNPFSSSATPLIVSGTFPSGTSPSLAIELTISGNVFAVPTLTLIPGGGSHGDSGIREINITNLYTGETLTVSGILNYLNEIVIDYSTFRVTISGIESDYKGIFSRFNPGYNLYLFSVASGVINTFNWVLNYYPRYYE